MHLQTELSDIRLEDWGLVDYSEALLRQQEYVLQRASNLIPDTVIFCTHPPVVTLGRATKSDDLLGWQGQTVEVSRGGRATYHGPSQLVVYPILNLKKSRQGRPAQDITGYLRVFEDVIVECLEFYGVQAEGRSLQKKDSLNPEQDETGVWVAARKIASLGIAVKKWISFHGAAINLDFDERAFQGLKPCGFQPSVMVSLEELIGKKVSREEFKMQLGQKLLKKL